MYVISSGDLYDVGTTDNTFIDAIETLDLAIAWYDGTSAYPKAIGLYPIHLSESVPGAADFADGVLLYEENGVRMRFVGQDKTGRIAFIRIDNLSDRDTSLEISEVRVGDLRRQRRITRNWHLPRRARDSPAFAR